MTEPEILEAFAAAWATSRDLPDDVGAAVRTILIDAWPQDPPDD